MTYIPNNAYLVYGSADDVARSTATGLHESGCTMGRENTQPRIALIPGSRVRRSQPAVDNRSAAGNEQFAIQLVEDAPENATTLALIEQLKLEPILANEKVLGYVNVKVALPKEAVINQIAKRGDVVSIQPFVTPKKNDEREDVIMSGNLDWKCADADGLFCLSHQSWFRPGDGLRLRR